MNSKSRIAVAVLATGIGWALQALAGLENALVIGFVAGLLLARLVPAKSTCSLRPRDEPGAG